jgi:hypothetical protein
MSFSVNNAGETGAAEFEGVPVIGPDRGTQILHESLEVAEVVECDEDWAEHFAGGEEVAYVCS